MCYSKKGGVGRGDFAAVWRGGISWPRVVALGLGGSAWVSHTPASLERGD